MKNFDPYQSDLPVVEVFKDVKTRLAENNTLVLTAPPGAGKSTLLPLALLDEPWLKGKKILMLEPRRLAAKGIAYRMSDLIGEEVGKTIGYRIRFETKTSNQTRIEIITEGILTRILQNDNALEDVGLVIFDEFHERGVHADTALALTRETQAILRTDLRILIMSATMDTSVLTKDLGAPLVESIGRQYPVKVFYHGDICPFGQYQSDIGTGVANIIKDICQKEKGDLLVFLPGEREINDCHQSLERIMDSQNTVIHDLYGRLPQSKQQVALRINNQGKRKIVLATTIAETSLTIEGIKVVVDAGFTRVSQFDPKTGLSGLRTIRISIDAADQRAGRAGRLSSGVAYRLWSAATHSKLENHRTPEILEADLTPLMLNLYDWGQTDIHALFWLDPPPSHAVKEAEDLLEDLQAIANGKITDHGKRMNSLPTHPRIAHLLISAKEEGLVDLATDLAAILEEKDPLPKGTGIDISLRIEGLRRFRQNNTSGRGKWNRVEKIAHQYRSMMGIKAVNTSFDPAELGLLLVYAFPERVACARPGNNAQFQLANGAYAAVGHQDDLAHEPWLAVAHMHDRERGTGKIFLAAPLNPRDLEPFVKVVKKVDWNAKKGGLVAQEEWRMGRIILKTVPIKNPDQALIQDALMTEIKSNGARLLDFNERVIQWQNRILCLSQWNDHQDWPDVSTRNLLETAEQWLSPYLSDIKSTNDLKAIDLEEVLKYSISPEQQSTLEKLAPATIDVPSGSTIRLDYQSNGNPPILAVRLQEIFGMLQTPQINDRKVNVLMHILSPGFKLVQTTMDLENFWKSTYFEVRKELRIRYKKHAWPEDPMTATAIRGAKKRNPK